MTRHTFSRGFWVWRSVARRLSSKRVSRNVGEKCGEVRRKCGALQLQSVVQRPLRSRAAKTHFAVCGGSGEPRRTFSSAAVGLLALMGTGTPGHPPMRPAGFRPFCHTPLTPAPGPTRGAVDGRGESTPSTLFKDEAGV
jgi:hypothetical protein